MKLSLSLTLALLTSTYAILPGINLHSFSPLQPIPMQINSLTSTKTILPRDPYKFQFCKPVNSETGKVHITHTRENLGEWLGGDLMQNSPYNILTLQDQYCTQLCTAYLGRSKTHGIQSLIRNNYHHNWIIDNLPSASMAETSTVIQTWYNAGGFPVGFVDPKTNKVYVNNHVNIIIDYHQVDGLTASSEKTNRIVRFVVEPFSVNHQFKMKTASVPSKIKLPGNRLKVNSVDRWTRAKSLDPVVITNTADLSSCTPATEGQMNPQAHTTWSMTVSSSVGPQEATGVVLFTYDVIWKPSDSKWSSRWDIYLSMDGAIPGRFHWFQIMNSLLITFVLTGMIGCVVWRNLRRDLNRYNKVSTSDEEKAEEAEEFGWKLVHGDVFRQPSTYPMLLASLCGTGAQIFVMSLTTIVFSAFGFISPAYRGSLLTACLTFFALSGFFNGYITARIYKSFKGKEWQRATMLSATFYPGLFFGMFFILNLINWGNESTDAVPFATMVVVILLWFGVSTPLVFLGSYFGYKKETMEFPTATSPIPRQIPPQPWYTSTLIAMAVGGILPFGACFVELYLILSSIWLSQYYFVFGFLLIVYFILLVTSAEIAILLCYFQLCLENHNWKWRAFLTSGSVGVYIFCYSISYFQKLEAAANFATYALYFGYMAAISGGIAIMTGSAGLLACLWFNMVIYGSIKVD